jgi:hypothetical protein
MKGRPLTHNAKNNKQYFLDYYHKTNEDIICECGAHFKSHSKLKHLKSKKHIQVMELINKLKEKEMGEDFLETLGEI